MKKLPVFFILFAPLLLSLQQIDSPYEKFKEWYSENGQKLTLSKKLDDAEFELRVIPTEVKVLREVVRNEDMSSKEIREVYKQYDACYEFSFKMSVTGVQDILSYLSGNQEDYTTLQFYLLESIGLDFTLEKEGETIQPLRCSFENNYGTAPFITLHLVFERKEGDQLKKLTYNDQLLSNGRMSFDLSEINALKIPKIK